MVLCEVCHKKKATVHYTEVIKNQMIKINLCEGCAKEKGIDVYSKFSVADLLAGLADLEGGQKISDDLECAECGMQYREFKEVGRFGCAECFTTFGAMLTHLFETIHKTSKHVGKIPKKWLKRESAQKNVKDLEIELEKAIHSEAFEEAARLRDQISAMKEAKRYKK